MRLLLVTDLHGRRPAFERILASAGPVDALLLGGDITDFGSPIDVEKVVRRGAEAVPKVLAVAGNCDSAAIDQRLVELGVALHGRGVIYHEVRFQGLSAMPPWTHKMYQMTEEELAAALEAGRVALGEAGPQVVLSHAPPRGMRLDRTWLFQHVGSTALREYIERTPPALVVCGHIHEGRGIERLGPTTVVNCGHAASGEYAVAEIDDEVRVELREA